MISILAGAEAHGQSATTHPAATRTADSTTAIARGWGLLARGRIPEAARAAEQALQGAPHNPAALALAVEAAIAGGGARAGLDRYEQALGNKPLEEPRLLRRIAEALLQESAAAEGSGDAALLSLTALAAAGDADAVTALGASSEAGREARLRALASAGDERAVGELVKSLAKPGAQTVAVLQALGQSGSSQAAAAVSRQLTNGSPEVRGAAVEALGQLSQGQDAARLLPLLNDQSSYVRTKAAAALYRLGDASGLGLLQELANSDAPAGRLIAAEAMATRPDAAWLDLVRGLAGAQEPQVRIAAARLLAEQDPDLANRVLDQAMNDPNPAIREMASRTRASSEASLAGLRRLMRSDDARTRVSASSRVLELTG